jgi:hypothetical protein
MWGEGWLASRSSLSNAGERKLVGASGFEPLTPPCEAALHERRFAADRGLLGLLCPFVTARAFVLPPDPTSIASRCKAACRSSKRCMWSCSVVMTRAHTSGDFRSSLAIGEGVDGCATFKSQSVERAG